MVEPEFDIPARAASTWQVEMKGNEIHARPYDDKGKILPWVIRVDSLAERPEAIPVEHWRGIIRDLDEQNF